MLFVLPTLAAPPTALDLVGLDGLANPIVLPSRDSVLFMLRTRSLDDEADEPWTSEDQLMELPLAGGEPRALTTGEDSPYSIQVSPDQRSLLFQRHGDLYEMPLDGGEPEQLELEPAPYGARYSSDGQTLYFIGTPEAEEDGVRRGEAFRFEKRDHDVLYSVPTSGGEPTALTDGTRHVMDVVEQDGTVVVLSSVANNTHEAWIHPTASVLRDGVLEPIPNAEGCVDSLEFSPNGRKLGWVGCATGGITDAVYVYDIASKRTDRWIPDTDPTFDGLLWLDDKRLLGRVSVGVNTELWTFGASGSPKRLPVDTVLGSIALGPKGKTVIATASEPDKPNHLVSIDLKRGTSRVLYDPNPEVADWTLHSTEVFTWDSPEGVSLEGLLHTPSGESKGLAVMPHGGPDGVSKRWFNSRAVYLTARGYTVFEPNYRGGIAYGRDFYSANRGRLGPIEFMDIEAGVDALIAAKKADEKALFYGGWSWGGYTTAWTIGHTTRYRAAMAGAAVVDTVAQYVGSDINHGSVSDWEFKGRPWTEPERFAEANPSAFLAAVKTPTLILHGDRDKRVPFDQGVTLYRALSDLGVEVDFWVYPDEGHGIRKLAHKVHRLEAWADWFDSH